MLFLRKTPLFITSITRTIVTKPYYKKHLGASYSLARPQDDTKNSSKGRKYLNCLFYVASGYLTYKLFKKESLIPSVEAAVKSEDPTKRFNFIADVVEIAAPAVVYIEIKDTRRRDFFTGKPITISNGSGFIIQENGLILTNAHVVTNKPDSAVEVRLLDGKTYKGVVEDVDQQSDLATVRISASKLPIIKLGDSSVLRPGEFVVAIGSPLALSNTVTFGVVSSTNRGSDELGLQGRHMDFIQTDAAITFGNSGGPLVNLNGEAIGINSMKVTAGISFAIPSNYVKEFLKYAEGVKKTKGGALKRKYLGITMLTLSPQILSELRQRNEHIPPNVKNGVLVWKVIWGSPAFNGGLQPGDIVTHIDGKEVTSANDIYGLLNKGGSGTLNLIVVRNGRQIELQVTPESID